MGVQQFRRLHHMDEILSLAYIPGKHHPETFRQPVKLCYLFR